MSAEANNPNLDAKKVLNYFSEEGRKYNCTYTNRDGVELNIDLLFIEMYGLAHIVYVDDFSNSIFSNGIKGNYTPGLYYDNERNLLVHTVLDMELWTLKILEELTDSD